MGFLEFVKKATKEVASHPTVVSLALMGLGVMTMILGTGLELTGVLVVGGVSLVAGTLGFANSIGAFGGMPAK